MPILLNIDGMPKLLNRDVIYMYRREAVLSGDIVAWWVEGRTSMPEGIGSYPAQVGLHSTCKGPFNKFNVSKKRKPMIIFFWAPPSPRA